MANIEDIKKNKLASDVGVVLGDKCLGVSFQNETLNAIRRYAYQLFSIYLDRMCEKIVSRGFNYSTVDPINKLQDLEKEMLRTDHVRIANPSCLFLSVSDVIKRAYIGCEQMENAICSGEYRKGSRYMNTSCQKYYAFYFGKKKGSMPSKVTAADRDKLVAIIEVQYEDLVNDTEKKKRYYAYIGCDKVVFDEELVFQRPYAKYLDIFLLGFQNIINLMISNGNSVNSTGADYKVFTDNGGFMDKASVDNTALFERIKDFVNGDSSAIMLSKDVSLDIIKGTTAEQASTAGITFAKDVLSFISERPRSLLFGEPATGLNNSSTDDLTKEEEFLTQKAKVEFLPLMQHFCDLFGFSSDKLEFTSYFETMRTINIVKDMTSNFDDEIVDENIKMELRKAYYKMLGISATPPAIEDENENSEGEDGENDN